MTVRILCVAAAGLAIALPAPAAWGATAVSVAGTTLTVIGGAEVNAIAITSPGGGNLRVDDPSSTVTVSPPCIADTGGALCPLAGLAAISADGGDGADTVTLGPAILLPATLTGGTTGTDALTGGDGNDTITGNAEANTLTGAGGNDTINGGDGTDLIHGGDGNDTLDAGFNFAAGDQIFGDNGDDTLQGWAGADTLTGGDGNDTLSGRGAGDTLIGGNGDDALFGQDDSDPLLDGGPGDDTLDPGNCGAEHPGVVSVIDGGTGTNIGDLRGLDCYPYPYGGVTVTLDGLPNDLEADDATHAKYPMNVKNVTTLRTPSWGADTVVGSAADERFEGSGDRSDVTGGVGDHIDGGGGNDVIADSGTNEILTGGAGQDTVDFSSAGACSVSLDGVANDGPGAPANPDNVLEFENAVGCGGGGTLTGDGADNVLIGSGNIDVINGGAGDDALLGGGLNDQLNGGDGQDRLFGEGGDDTLHGDAGDDDLVGGTEKDTLIGDAGRDVADYSTAYFAVTATLDGAANDGLAGEQDNVQTDDVLGGQAADTITGDGTANRLAGGPGGDALHGGGGDDDLVGGGGADVLDGQAGSDTADYSGALGALTVTLDGAANDGVPGEGDNALTENVLGGAGADALTGDGGPNDLSGAEGNDTVAGGAGDDVLTGGPGLDAISSGAGADTLRARDGEADTLTCDALTGKIVVADSIDVSSTCDLSASALAPVLPGLTQRDPPLPPTGKAAALGPRSPAALAAALTGRVRPGAVVRLRPGTRRLRLGEIACRPGQRCSAKINVGAGAATLATGKVTVTGDRTALVASLSAEGRRILAVRRRVKAVATITLTEGRTRAVVRLRFVVAGGAR